MAISIQATAWCDVQKLEGSLKKGQNSLSWDTIRSPAAFDVAFENVLHEAEESLMMVSVNLLDRRRMLLKELFSDFRGPLFDWLRWMHDDKNGDS